MPNVDCPFCAQLRFCKETDEVASKARKHSDYRHEYRAALVCVNCYTDNTGEEWRTGGVTYGSFPLNFCPTCGNPLNK